MFALIDKWKAAVTEEVKAKRASREQSLDTQQEALEKTGEIFKTSRSSKKGKVEREKPMQ